jgi:hypothetical protein
VKQCENNPLWQRLEHLGRGKTGAGPDDANARQTVDQWLNSGDRDFAEALQAAREAYDASIPHKLAGAMDGALAQIVKKLPEADARASATIYGILFDKRQISSGKATSISSKSEDIDKRLNDIGTKLENMAERHRRTTVKAV